MQPITGAGKSRQRGARRVNCARHLFPFTLQPIECALQQERPEPKTTHLSISMPSARARDVDIDTGRRMGADLYLAKPMDPSALVVQGSTLLEEESRDG